MFDKPKYFLFIIRSKIVLILGEVSRMALADDNIRINHIIWYSRTSQLINILWNIMYSKDNGWPFENYEPWCDCSSTLLRVCCECVCSMVNKYSKVFQSFFQLSGTNIWSIPKCSSIIKSFEKADEYIEIFKYILSKEISNHELDKIYH